jgi:putative flippase GtrA
MVRHARVLRDTPDRRKAVRYSVVSVLSVLVSQGMLLLTFGALRLGSAIVCNVVATSMAAVPSYYLNRRWAWGDGEGRTL